VEIPQKRSRPRRIKNNEVTPFQKRSRPSKEDKKTINRRRLSSFGHTHSHSLIHSEGRRKFEEGDATTAVAEVILVQSLWYLSLLCATLGKGALPLYGAAAAVGVVFLVVL
jgi:hypothetical protein